MTILAAMVLAVSAPAAADPSEPGPGLQPEVVGGTLAGPADFPWIAALSRNGNDPFHSLACGGSVVARRWVVTAAHCITEVGPFNPMNYRVIIGVIRLPTTPDPAHTYAVASVQVDPRWNPSTHAYDVAVLQLTRDVPGAPVMIPRLPDAAAWAAGQTATVAGWGTTSEGGATSQDLRKASLPVVSDTTCGATYGLSPTLKALMLCAGLPQGGVDTCQGDSGGPLLVTGPAGPLLAGATSFGTGCARPGIPGVYTELAAVRDFLEGAIAPNPPVLVAASGGAGSATVTFAASASDLGVDVTGFSVVASPGGQTVTVPASATSATLTGLANGTTYALDVQALSAVGASPVATAAVTTTSGLGTYTPVPPQRLVDTRQSSPVTARTSLAVGVTGQAGLPASDVAAVTLNLTATDPAAAGYVTAYPCGTDPPLASNVNYGAGQTVANAVTVAVGTGGAVCLFSLATAHVVVDVTGWYSAATGPIASRFTPVVPARLLDTRTAAKVAGGATVMVPVLGREGLPASGVTAVTLNVTATDGEASGYLTVYPCGGSPPLASNVNYAPGQTVPNAVTVAVGSAGAICVFSLAPTHVVVDVTGYSSDAPDGPGSRLRPMAPLRLMDTRSGQGGTRLAAGSVVPLPVVSLLEQAAGAPPDVAAVVLNVTAAGAGAAGFVTVFPCGSAPPLASNLNYVAGDVVPNQVTVGVGPAGDVCFTSLADVDLIVDATGAYGP